MKCLTAADPRDKPAYIKNSCDNCSSELKLWDEVNKRTNYAPCFEEEFVDIAWFDEWCCPKCNDGVYMDWPSEKMNKLIELRDECVA